MIEQNDDILVIRKSRGPYKGLFDLPGGRPSHGEPLLEALTREIKEETGIEAENYSFFGNFSFLIPYKDSDDIQKELYHIALTYRVKNIEIKSFNPNIIDEDVNGSLWINRHNIRKEDSSPLLRSILDRLKRAEDIYKEWEDKAMHKEYEITIDNIFADLGLPQSEEVMARAKLLYEVGSLMKASKLSQQEIAQRLGISQPKMSMLISGRLSVFSNETLLHYLKAL